MIRMAYSRVKLRFARGVEVTFANRDKALKQIEKLAEEGIYEPIVIYGPEGCGKTALFKQTYEILESMGYTVIYVNPIEDEEEEWRIRVSPDSRSIVEDVLRVAVGEKGATLVDLAIKIFGILSKRRKLVALLADDIFQAVGLDRAEIYVKRLLNFVEYPPEELEKAFIFVGSSEGITKTRVGRHRWAGIRIMWNMSRDGFRELYEQIPGEKPQFEEIWRLTGGNPGMLKKLYMYSWSADSVIDGIIAARGLKRFIDRLSDTQRRVLLESIEDPDALVFRLREARTRQEKDEIITLIDSLIELNLIVDDVSIRSEHIWIDEPPTTDRDIGIGDETAWQSPLHREAIRKTLKTHQHSDNTRPPTS
ncbi:ATPase [Ignisphaera aggregans DSM 17230]|uniref:ATPase n=1 Tax=Ignisphaera aggregans (strain DSM 17230 / JCM 13409 / AQ1.S1) TaxID=583356 RepID=E0SSX5_IGNAA|nr:ATPase [Ignisphaera aggregans DSM 17230]